MTANGKTVLLVEDNEDNRIVYSTILRHFGYTVTEALNGEEGIVKARTEKPLLSYEKALANRLSYDWDNHVSATPAFVGRRYLDDVPLAEKLPNFPGAQMQITIPEQLPSR